MPCSFISVIAAHIRRVSVFALTAALQTCPRGQHRSLFHNTVNEWNQHISWLLMCEPHSLLSLRNLNWIPAPELPACASRCQGCFTGSRLFNSILVIGNCSEEGVGLDFGVIWSPSLMRGRLYFLLWALWKCFCRILCHLWLDNIWWSGHESSAVCRTCRETVSLNNAELLSSHCREHKTAR